MIGILLITHAPLGQAFVQAATHVFHHLPEKLEAIDVAPSQNAEHITPLARDAVARLDDGSGVLIITDIIGGTPSNCCNQLHAPGKVATIAGINLSMLLRALTYRHHTLDVVVEKALAGGQNGAIQLDQPISFQSPLQKQ